MASSRWVVAFEEPPESLVTVPCEKCSSTSRGCTEARAFHARWVVADAFEHGQLAQPFWMGERVGVPGHHLVELLEHVPGLAQRLTLDAVGHHRSRRFRDRASRPLEAGVLDHAVLDLQVERQPIPAERVVALGVPVGAFHRAEVARPAVMVEDDLLIELPKIGHWGPPVGHVKSSRTLWSAATRASISSRVLYSASDARAVAGMPN